MNSIDRYMARLIAVPLFSTLVISAMLLILDRMLRLFDFVATAGGPISVVWRMLANLLPEYLGLGIPIGLMLGILLAFRKLATTSELDVMRGVGMSYSRLLRVPYLYAIVLAIANLAIVGYVQPRSRYAYEQLRYELRTGALGASIKIGEFTHLGSRMTLRIERSQEGGRDLSGIFVNVRGLKGEWLAVTAERGRFLGTPDKNVIIFRLTNGTLIHNQPSFKTPRVLTFDSHNLPIDLPKFENFRGRGNDTNESTLIELARSGQDASTRVARESNRAEFHFRLAEVASMFFLPLLALALGVPPKRSTSGLGVVVAIIMIVTYFKVSQYAQGVGEVGRIDPLIALWVPLGIFAALSTWMFYVIAYIPGGQPIGALEQGFTKLRKSLARLLPGRRRTELAA